MIGRALARLLRWRHARAATQLPTLALAGIMVWDGLTGPQLAPKNLATVLTWLHYRGFLVLALLLVGNLFCMACPFMFVRNLARRLRTPRRAWPARLRGKWLAAGLLAFYLFAYELFDLWASPWWTAILILGYFLAATLVDAFFKGAPFCKHVCPLGQFNFLASTLSPAEIRVRDLAVCGGCATKDCIRGRGDIPGCELGLFQERKVGNLDCTFCLDCVQACPEENVTLMLRPIGPELWEQRWRSGVGTLHRRADLALLASVFTFGALLNAFAMVSPVYAVSRVLSDLLGTRSEGLVLGALFTLGLVLEPLVLLLGAGWLSRRLSGTPDPLLKTITRFSFSLVPVGVSVWLVHYLFHFLTGFWGFVPVFQDIAWGMGWTWLGKPQWQWAGSPTPPWLLPLEVGLLGLGFLVAATSAHRIAQGHTAPRAAQAALPWQALALALTLAAIWLMQQPMEMRGTLLGG